MGNSINGNDLNKNQFFVIVLVEVAMKIERILVIKMHNLNGKIAPVILCTDTYNIVDDFGNSDRYCIVHLHSKCFIFFFTSFRNSTDFHRHFHHKNSITEYLKYCLYR